MYSMEQPKKVQVNCFVLSLHNMSQMKKLESNARVGSLYIIQFYEVVL